MLRDHTGQRNVSLNRKIVEKLFICDSSLQEKKQLVFRGAKLKECPQKFDTSFLDLLMISTDAKLSGQTQKYQWDID